MFTQDPGLITESLRIKPFSKDCKEQSVKKVDSLVSNVCTTEVSFNCHPFTSNYPLNLSPS